MPSCQWEGEPSGFKAANKLSRAGHRLGSYRNCRGHLGKCHLEARVYAHVFGIMVVLCCVSHSRARGRLTGSRQFSRLWATVVENPF